MDLRTPSRRPPQETSSQQKSAEGREAHARRLLINLVLLSGGLPWVTVRADERGPFFQSIEAARLDGDTEPFIRYLWHQIRQAINDLEKRRRRTVRRRTQ